MPKIPYKPDKKQDDDEDYEIVSFEDFCDKSGGSKTDLLTLNDNINYRLCYESDKGSGLNYEGEGSSKDAAQMETETSLSKNIPKRKTSGNFAPFGRYNANKAQKGSLFGGVIPKPRAAEAETSGSEARGPREQHRYQRFSRPRNFCQQIGDHLPGLGSSILVFALVCALFVGVWWAVCGALGGAWGEEHYRKLWERAHPDNFKKPLSPIPFEKSVIKMPPMMTQSETVQVPEYRYHDHNNLSTKNKNATIETKKKEPNKKNFIDLSEEQQSEVCEQIPDKMKFDCSPNANQSVCEKRGCCWKNAETEGAPYCYYPPGYDTFRFVNMTENKHGIRVTYSRGRPSGYPGDFANVVLDFKYLSDDTLQFKIYDADRKRFEPPIPQIPMVAGPISKLQYRVQVDSGSIGFKVIRNSDNVTIINTQDVGALILSDRFLQISTLLPTDRIFGFGEHMDRLKKNMNWKTYTMFNKDQPTTSNINLYGTHPFYLGVEKDGKSHGMFLLNSNAMDVVLQPTPALTYRTVGGILNFMLFVGPTPQQVLSQYTAVIGRPHMPPYWALGFHLCKFGYGTLNKTREVWKANRDAGIPFDVQWNDIDYMDRRNDFTIDPVGFKGLPEFVKEVHNAGMHYVMLFDPGVSASEPRGQYPPFDRGLEMNVFVRNTSNLPFTAKVWNLGKTVFPDFTHPNATGYWTEMMADFHKRVNYDGAWIDMNEPSNFANGQVYGPCEPWQLPYKPQWIWQISDKTLCMDARHHIGLHYDVHNLYSLYESVATNFALLEIRGKRPFVLSRSTFPGSGRYAAHWTGDNESQFNDMRYSIYDMLSFSLFGIPLVGADICGFNRNTTVDLCKRWMQLGAFYPFARNHNSDQSIPQDPVSLGPEVVKASITALRLRYRLLPYYYTLFWEAHTKGHTVATPVFFLAPENPQLDKIDNQFLIGHHVMIAPILDERVNITRATFPGPNKWFSLATGAYLATNQSAYITDGDMVSVQGGAILPLQEPASSGPVTTANSRSRPLQLLAVPDHKRTAAGQLYWDDGDSANSLEEKKYSHIEFTLVEEVFTSKVIWWGFGVPSINNITVLDQPRPVQRAILNGLPVKFEYNDKCKSLHFYGLNYTLDKPFVIKWIYHDIVLKKRGKPIRGSRKFKKTIGVVKTVVGCKGKECSEND